MVSDPLALRVNNFVLCIAILELFASFGDVRIHAAVSEGTLSSPFVKQTTRDLTQSPFVLLH